MKLNQDQHYMQLALKEAHKAYLKGEVPIGAVAVCEDKVIAKSHNLKELKHNSLAHAEVLLLQKVSQKLQRWRLAGVTLYVTLEPCLMCMGALMQARISRLVFGCLDAKGGACGSLYNFAEDRRLNHRLLVTSQILERECSQLLSQFFKELRQKKTAGKIKTQ